MLKRSYKELFYSLMHYPMRLNAARHRLFQSPHESLKVQLGPGMRNYFPGWTNVDANFITAKVDVWADFSAKLPFRNETVDAFYSHHVIEHLPDNRLPFHFGEMFRCLKKGGVIRIGGPNGDSAAKKLLEGDGAWFGDFPDKRESVGGRYANFILCRGEHFTILTSSYLDELAAAAGFGEIRFCLPIKDTNYPQTFDQTCLSTEFESDWQVPHTIILEARKK